MITIKKISNIRPLIALLVFLAIFFCIHSIVVIFEKDFDIASEGNITIHDLRDSFISIEGEFRVYDGIIDSEVGLSPKYMSLDDLIKYKYPSGTATAFMTVNLDNSKVSGLLIEEIYTSNEIYIDDKLVSKVGIVSETKKTSLREKKSVLIPINDTKDKFTIKIKIANFDLISGQFEKNIYVGDFLVLNDFNNKRLALKFLGVTFYFSISLILFGLYYKNKKYEHHLTLAIAGFFNFYILLIHYEPMVLFNIKGTFYLFNSYFSPLPSLFSQFFSAMTVILYFKEGSLYKNRKNFIKINTLLLIFVVLIVIIFDDVVNFLYILSLTYVMGLMVYSLIISAKHYIKKTPLAIWIYFGLAIYIISYNYLIYFALFTNKYQTISYYNIYMILGQILFYLIISYVSVTKFSSNFHETEIEEEKLESLVNLKTKELEDSYKELLIQDNIRKQMLQDISHDLRSPITVVKGYAELMKTNQIPYDQQSKYIDIIYHKTGYVSNLINELFALNGLENNKNYSMDIECLNDIINNTVLSFKTERIILNLEKEIYLYCNEKQMYRLFNNLIENAIEHSKDDKEIIIDLYKNNENVIFRITDFGVGIPVTDLPYIFNRFSRSDKSRNTNENHFGLGLSISKAIVKNHNGEIFCDSKINHGTTFTIYLPYHEKEEIYENINR